MMMFKKIFDNLKYSFDCKSQYEEFGVIDFYKDIRPFCDNLAPDILARLAVFYIQLGYTYVKQRAKDETVNFVYAIQYDILPDIDQPFIIPHVVFSRYGENAIISSDFESVPYKVFHNDFQGIDWPHEIKMGKISRLIFDDGVIRYLIFPLLKA